MTTRWAAVRSGDSCFLKDGLMVGLGDLPGGDFLSGAVGISSDGTVVVGRATTENGPEAFRWTHSTGMQSVQQLLDAHGSDLVGWQLIWARSVSDDGKTLTGWGTNPNGEMEAWIATIPEPFTALLLVCGLAGLAAAGRRPRRPWERSCAAPKGHSHPSCTPAPQVALRQAPKCAIFLDGPR